MAKTFDKHKNKKTRKFMHENIKHALKEIFHCLSYVCIARRTFWRQDLHIICRKLCCAMCINLAFLQQKSLLIDFNIFERCCQLVQYYMYMENHESLSKHHI